MSRLRSSGPEDTERIAAELATRLRPGDVVLVRGELGAGKTTFVRGACRALGVEGPVVSPTFTIGRRYAGRIPVSHLDLYRVSDLADEDPGILDDYLTPDAVAFVEWPQLAEPSLDRGESEGTQPIRLAAVVEIAHAGDDEREITIVPPAGGAAVDGRTGQRPPRL